MRESFELDDRFTTEYFLMGTHYAEFQPEFGKDQLLLCSVRLPKLDKGVKIDRKENEL